MIQPIYTSVSNADRVTCGKKGQKVPEQVVPLIRQNYLSEFKTELEKAKARANLGIGDAYNLSWKNISGHLEDNEALIKFIQEQWEYSYSSPYVREEITNVKEALDYVLYYISTFENNDEAVTTIQAYINSLQKTILPNLEKSIEDGDEAVKKLITDKDGINDKIKNAENAIAKLNTAIDSLNESLEEINVDKNILAWIKDSLQESKTIELADDTLSVKVSKEDKNGISIKNDGLYVQDLSEAVDKIDEVVNDVNNIKQSLTYEARLPESTTSPSLEGITVGDLKNKTLSQVIDTLFFPATVRDLVQPTIEFGSYDTLVEVGSIINKPTVLFTKGDAGETISQTVNLTYNNATVTTAIYDNLGTYVWTATYSYQTGDYLKDNRGEVTTKRINEGQLQNTLTVNTTYPWYAGSIKQELVPFNTVTDYITITLGSVATIELPGENSQIQSFEVNSGLGFQAVNLEDWTTSTETKNGITYKVWTKNSEYYSDLEHRIKIKLA